jgi:hypothetical protein
MNFASLRSDWDQKASSTIHKKNSKGTLKCLQKAPFLTFCIGDSKSPYVQCRIAFMATPPLSEMHHDVVEEYSSV